MACIVDYRCVDNCVGVAAYFYAHYYLHTYRAEMLPTELAACLVKLASPEPGVDRGGSCEVIQWVWLR